MEINQPFKVLRTCKEALLPKKGSKFSAGYDVHSRKDMVIPARGRDCVPTGLKMEIPTGSYGRISPRSGLAVKNGIDVGAGVVDSDYRGEVHVMLFNHSDTPFYIKIGDRIAQIIIEKLTSVELVEVQSIEETERGECGIGSTGTGLNVTPHQNTVQQALDEFHKKK